MKYTVIHLNDRLQLSITSIGSAASKSVTVELSRIGAQNLADTLLQYSGSTSKAAGLGRSAGIPCIDLDPPPEARPARVVRVGSAKSSGPRPVVRLNTPR